MIFLLRVIQLRCNIQSKQNTTRIDYPHKSRVQIPIWKGSTFLIKNARASRLLG